MLLEKVVILFPHLAVDLRDAQHHDFPNDLGTGFNRISWKIEAVFKLLEGVMHHFVTTPIGDLFAFAHHGGEARQFLRDRRFVFNLRVLWGH